MSFSLDLDSLSKEERLNILEECSVRPHKDQFNNNTDLIECFNVDADNNLVYLPLGKWENYFMSLKDGGGFPNGNTDDFPTMNKKCKFTKELLTPENDPLKRDRDQVSVVNEALQQLQSRGTTLIALFTGGGKTAVGVYLSIYLGLKTLVMCHVDVVKREGWPQEYAFFSDNTIKVQFLKGKNIKLDPEADVYIVGVLKAAKMQPEDFVGIGTIIIDELHIATEC